MASAGTGPTSWVTSGVVGAALADAWLARMIWLALGLLGVEVPSPTSRPEPGPEVAFPVRAGETACDISLMTGAMSPCELAEAPEKAISPPTRRSPATAACGGYDGPPGRRPEG